MQALSWDSDSRGGFRGELAWPTLIGILRRTPLTESRMAKALASGAA